MRVAALAALFVLLVSSIAYAVDVRYLRRRESDVTTSAASMQTATTGSMWDTMLWDSGEWN